MYGETTLKIFNKAVVCEDNTLRGDITISPGCVIHPTANIIAEAGPIILGENCIVEEYATIAYRMSQTDEDKSSCGNSTALIIGANNVFEVGCTVEANRIGDKNVFECKCYVGPEVTVSSGCIVGAGVHLQCNYQLPENTVVNVRDCMQRETIDNHAAQTLQIDFLRKVLPNYHHLRKPNQDSKKSRNAV